MIDVLKALAGRSDLWTIYDNATDEPIAYGSLEEMLSQTSMSREAFDGLLKEYRQGKREFVLLGKKRSVNIMLNGSGSPWGLTPWTKSCIRFQTSVRSH